jgi:hypothetical protein
MNLHTTSLPNSGLTDAQLRATPLPVTVPTPVPVTDNSGSLTVDGSVSVSNLPATQAVSAAALPLPAGASTETTLALIKAKTDNLDVALSTRTKPADTQTISGSVSVSNFPATQPVTGTFFQTTQPVSLAVAPTTPVTGTFWQATQPVSIASMPSTPVIGTFFQATQPVSGTVTANAGTGNFTVAQATGTNLHVVVDTAPTTAVTGTFWQATQPVSGTVTTAPPSNASTNLTQIVGTAADVNSGTKSAGTLRVVLATDQPALTNKLLVTPDSVALPANQSVNVSQMGGTATSMNTGVRDAGTQRVTIATNDVVPVSGTVTTSPPANASTNVTQLVGTAVDVNSGTKSAGTLRVVLATDQPALTNKLLVTPDSVALPANQSVNVNQLGGTAISLNTGVRDAGTQRVTIATNDVVPVTGTFFQATQPVSGTVTANIGTLPTLTKGTQGTTGLSTQDLKDAGRNVTNYFMAAGVAGTNAEVMQLLTGYKGGAAVAATATPAVVTAAKTYRITSITLSYQSLATAGACLFRLRANTSGAGVIGSPLVMTFTVGSLAAVAGVTNTLDIPFPDGLEFAAGTGIAVGMIGLSAVGAALAAGFGTITIYGYEY